MKVFIISMFNEYSNVEVSLSNIRKFDPLSYIIIVHSDCESYNDQLDRIKKVANNYYILPNLAKIYDRYEFPSHSIMRNLMIGFSTIYSYNIVPEYIVVFNGDTIITDATNFDRIYNKIKSRNAIAAVSQAIGQDFHADNSDPINGKCGGRYQGNDTTDFACSLFIIDGKFALEHKAFANIPITNKYATEQCLGDELLRCTGPDFHKKVIRLNEDNIYFSYNYKDGILYHQHIKE